MMSSRNATRRHLLHWRKVRYDRPQAHASRRFLLAVCQKNDNIIELEYWSPSRMEALWSQYSDQMTFPPLAKLVTTVYEMTPPHCHELRDVLVWYTKLYPMRSQLSSPIESPKMVRAIEETPSFAADLALSVPSQAWFCGTFCGTQDPKVNPALARRCRCGWIDRCEKPGCPKAIQERSICLFCYHSGTLAPIEPDESLDDMESD